MAKNIRIPEKDFWELVEKAGDPPAGKLAATPKIALNAKERAVEVANMPHVKSWVKAFQEICARMPKEVEVFVGGANCVLALNEEGKPFMTHHDEGRRDGASGGGVDVEATIATFKGNFDGGDF